MLMKSTHYIPRDIEPALRQAVKQFPSILITGPRQSGKTRLSVQLFSKTHKYVTFDDIKIRGLAIKDPELFLEKFQPPLIIDEIQYAPQILPYIKMSIDTDRDSGGKFILTGSQQFALMQNVTESLAGRVGMLTLLPMSRAERVREKTPKKVLAGNLGNEWIRGGFPELVARPGISTGAWYSSYLQTYLERDVRSIRQVGDLGQYMEFISALAARNTGLLNLAELSRDLGVALNTIKAWVSVLEASFQIFVIRPYYRNLGKRLVKNPKAYFTETGLVCHLLGIEDPGFALSGPTAGSLLETAVLSEIIKGFFNRGELPKIYFWRTSAGNEVDFIVERKGLLIPIEVKLTKTSNSGLAKGVDSFCALFGKQSPKGYVVCLTDERFPLSRSCEAVPFQSLPDVVFGKG